MTKYVSAKELAQQQQLAKAKTPAQRHAAAQRLVTTQIRNERKWKSAKRWWKP
jgi:hypothetical protein